MNEAVLIAGTAMFSVGLIAGRIWCEATISKVRKQRDGAYIHCDNQWTRIIDLLCTNDELRALSGSLEARLKELSNAAKKRKVANSARVAKGNHTRKLKRLAREAGQVQG